MIDSMVLADRSVRMLDEWVERWKRADKGPHDAYTLGRRDAYCQAIAFLLDRPYVEVHMALRGDQL